MQAGAPPNAHMYLYLHPPLQASSLLLVRLLPPAHFDLPYPARSPLLMHAPHPGPGAGTGLDGGRAATGPDWTPCDPATPAAASAASPAQPSRDQTTP